MERGATLTKSCFDARVIIPSFIAYAYTISLSISIDSRDGVCLYAIRRVVDITEDEREEAERHEEYTAVYEQKRTQTMYTC